MGEAGEGGDQVTYFGIVVVILAAVFCLWYWSQSDDFVIDNIFEFEEDPETGRRKAKDRESEDLR